MAESGERKAAQQMLADMQAKYAALQRRFEVLVAERGGNATNGFVQRLIDVVANSFDDGSFSDLTIHAGGQQLRGHKLVLAAHSDYWDDLKDVSAIYFDDTSLETANILLRWMYTNEVDDRYGHSVLLDVLRKAVTYHLEGLRDRCEDTLVARLDIDNCIPIYQFAEHESRTRLRDECAELVAARWNDFTPRHFADMDASLVYRILKRRSKHVLNAIIKLGRADALQLLFDEAGSEAAIRERVNEPDEDDVLPLDVALTRGEADVARILVERGADLNKLDRHGQSFVFKAVQRGDVDACEFLASNGAMMNYVNQATGETLLHILASSDTPANLLRWAERYSQQFYINATDKKLRTPLMVAIDAGNRRFFDLLLGQANLDVNLADRENRTPLSVALLEKKDLDFAQKLVEHGADVEVPDQDSRTLLHRAVDGNNFPAVQFLAQHSANVNAADSDNSTPPHLFMDKLNNLSSVSPEHLDVLKILIKSGADFSIQQKSTGLTPLHMAVQRDVKALEVILASAPLGLPLDVTDSTGRTPLWAALEAAKFPAAQLLLRAGANINEVTPEGTPILIKAIESRRDDIIRFLLDNRADTGVSTANGASCLRLAVAQGLTSTVDQLCKLGTQLDTRDPETGLPPLWTALENDDYATASVLIANGCDTEGVALAGDGLCRESMLLKAIDKNDQKAAVFLIKNGCNVNAVREVVDEANLAASGTDPLQTPLHLSVQWCQTEVTAALISSTSCRIDAADSDGRTAVHFAVSNDDSATLDMILAHPDVSCLSVRDRYGVTPLGLAMKLRNNKAAEAICKRVPHAVLQTNGGGENLLHSVVRANDFESVLFLLGLHVDVNIPVQNADRLTAMHYAAEGGNEMIVRNLILAGADINAQSSEGATPLHVACAADNSEIVRILVENGADPDVFDADGTTALHVAVTRGSIESVRILLTESDVNPYAFNKKRQNILHLCAITIGPLVSDMFRTILEILPEFPLECQDTYGNTMFLLAFINGNAELCRLALRHGACLAAVNHTGQSIFKVDTPTKQLLFGLLDTLESEPKWADGDFCSECDARFSLTMRKHHCRHCGRLACAKCTERQMPIVKYNLTKNVRVCQMCFDVLTIGGADTNVF